MKKEELNDKTSLVAYCGLYCPECYNMRVGHAAESLIKELGSAQEKGATFGDYSSLKTTLQELADLQCLKFCREGGGRSANCKIKKCCDSHEISGCWDCPDFEKCNKLKPQFVNNIKKIKKIGINKYIECYK